MQKTPAEIYERHLAPVLALWTEELIELAALRSGERLLDLACGTGLIARLAARHLHPGGQIVGLDINLSMLQVGRGIWANRDVWIEWVQGSALSLPIADAKFDLVLCQQGLQFFPDRAQALGEIRRVLAPGARLGFSVWRSIEHNPAQVALTEGLRHYGAQEGSENVRHAFSLGDARQLRRLLAGARFRDIEVRPVARTARYQSPEEFVTVILGSAAGRGVRVSDEARAGVIGHVSRALKPYMDDKGLAFPMEAHLAVART